MIEQRASGAEYEWLVAGVLEALKAEGPAPTSRLNDYAWYARRHAGELLSVDAVRASVADRYAQETFCRSLLERTSARGFLIAEMPSMAAVLSRVRIHEAGHAVAAVALGARVDAVVVDPSQGVYRTECDDASMAAADRIVMLWAAAAAELHILGTVSPLYASTDLLQPGVVLAEGGAQPDPAPAFERACALVVPRSAAIMAIASALVHMPRLPGSVVHRLVDAHETRQDRAGTRRA
jgi:hypothetical protein